MPVSHAICGGVNKKTGLVSRSDRNVEVPIQDGKNTEIQKGSIPLRMPGEESKSGVHDGHAGRIQSDKSKTKTKTGIPAQW